MDSRDSARGLSRSLAERRAYRAFPSRGNPSERNGTRLLISSIGASRSSRSSRHSGGNAIPNSGAPLETPRVVVHENGSLARRVSRWNSALAGRTSRAKIYGGNRVLTRPRKKMLVFIITTGAIRAFPSSSSAVRLNRSFLCGRFSPLRNENRRRDSRGLPRHCYNAPDNGHVRCCSPPSPSLPPFDF